MKAILKQSGQAHQAQATNRLFSAEGVSGTCMELLVAIALLALPLAAAEPRPGSVDLSFASIAIDFQIPLDGSSAVEDIAVAPDGKIYIGGHFSAIGGIPRDAVARLNADGSLDRTFESLAPLNHDTHTVFVQPDGSMIVGYYQSYRINSDGTLDGRFRSNLGILGQQSDGMLLGCSVFVDENGGRGNISVLKRFFPDGKRDAQFVNAYRPEYGLYRRPILVQRDGKLLFFHSEITDDSIRRLSRFNADGAIDSSFSVTASISSGAGAKMVVQDGGKILLEGSFDRGDGTATAIVRLNSDGSLDTGFTASIALSPQPAQSYGFVRAMAVQPDGKILIGGSLGLIRLNPDGSLDQTFSELSELEINVNRVVLQPDGGILVARSFQSLDGYQAGIIRLHGDSPILRLDSPQRLNDGSVQIRIADFTGRSSVVEATTALVPPNWKPIWTNTAGSELFTVTDADASASPRRYYRALRP